MHPPCWIFVPLDSSDSPATEVFLSRVPEEERRLLLRRPVRDRYAGLCARLLVHALACRHLSLDNTRLQFGVAEKGKPYLKGFPSFQFSISHTRGAVAAAVAETPVGVDVEKIRPVREGLARRFFTPGEQAYILEDSADLQRFFHVWTRKEAALKQSGQGLSAGLDSFDALSGAGAERLVTVRQGAFVTSLCAREPIPLTVLKEEQLLAAARQLAPYPGV